MWQSYAVVLSINTLLYDGKLQTLFGHTELVAPQVGQSGLWRVWNDDKQGSSDEETGRQIQK